MTRPSNRELDKRISDLQEAAEAKYTDSEAYALLVGAASGDEAAAGRWSEVDSQQRNRLTANF